MILALPPTNTSGTVRSKIPRFGLGRMDAEPAGSDMPILAEGSPAPPPGRAVGVTGPVNVIDWVLE